MSYIVALYHIVFSTKGREATLDKEHRAELFSFIAGIVKRKGCKPIIVNGGVDHVHILLDLSSTMTLSEVVKEIKRSSTLWIKERKIFPMFSHWESEYGAFSVSKSHRDAVYSYIMNQEQHHSHLNVLDEFNRLLAKNYNPRFVQPLFGGRFLFQQLTPGRRANLGLQLYNRPSAVASPFVRHHPSNCANGAIHRHRRKNRRRAV